jgi:flavodoxin
MRILVLYESRRGFTLTVARAIRDELRRRGHLATTAPLRAVDAGTITASDALIVGTWVQGLIIAKVRPSDAAMAGIDALPPLAGRPASTFCTCDVAPGPTLDRMASRLTARGATVVGGFAFRRKKSLRHVPAYVDAVLPALEAARPSTVRAT